MIWLNSSNLDLTYDDFKNGDYYVALVNGEICLYSTNPSSHVTIDYEQDNSSLNSSAADNPDSQVISTLNKSTGIPIALLLVVLAIVGVGFIKKD